MRKVKPKRDKLTKKRWWIKYYLKFCISTPFTVKFVFVFKISTIQSMWYFWHFKKNAKNKIHTSMPILCCFFNRASWKKEKQKKLEIQIKELVSGERFFPFLQNYSATAWKTFRLGKIWRKRTLTIKRKVGSCFLK